MRLEAKGSPEAKKIYVPYRNSLMTMVLRDSLGGNCKTRMINTISAEEINLHESMSTCRFAQRVACIKNTVRRNESLDPSLVIERLRRENQELKAELALLKGEAVKDCLSGEEKDKCESLVNNYIDEKDPSKGLMLNDRLMITECFSLMKRKCLDGGGTGQGNSGKEMAKPQATGGGDPAKERALSEEVMKLKVILQQREAEITILLNLINKRSGGGGMEESSQPIRQED